jgi:SAM-dependent methyltransferase
MLSMNSAIYDRIGQGYSRNRRPDPRIQKLIAYELGDHRTIVNVGAGTGSYEPEDRFVIAVEPSITMIRQRPEQSAPVIRAVAAHLPFTDSSFDVSLAVLTVHHWPDPSAGLAELLRVAGKKLVILTWDPFSEGFWLTQRYFSDITDGDRVSFPTLDEFRKVLGIVTVIPVPIPHDCTDGFLGAYWCRPEAYLDPAIRAGISAFSRITNVQSRIDRLRADLDNGEWDRNYGHLRNRSRLDIGYRIITCTK